MTTRGLQPSEWGGEIEFVDVSAKTQVGLQDLLDTLLVVAELEELKANPTAPACACPSRTSWPAPVAASWPS